MDWFYPLKADSTNDFSETYLTLTKIRDLFISPGRKLITFLVLLSLGYQLILEQDVVPETLDNQKSIFDIFSFFRLL